MIQVEKLSKSFHDQVILKDLSIRITPGEIVAVLGESGTGKSVLLKHLMGLIKPDAGRILIDGVDITRLSERKLLPLRRSIGYLFQEGALYDFMTVYENLVFPLKEHTKMDEKAMAEKVRQILSFVDLEGVEKKFPSELSGGMRKRVGLARSIVLDSRILFCDEPTSGLDPIRSRDISDLIRHVSQKMQCTTVITSHDIPNSFRIADRVALLKDGHFVAVGTPEEIRQNPDPFVREFIE